MFLSFEEYFSYTGWFTGTWRSISLEQQCFLISFQRGMIRSHQDYFLKSFGNIQGVSDMCLATKIRFFFIKHPLFGPKFLKHSENETNLKFFWSVLCLKCAFYGIFLFKGDLISQKKTPQIRQKWIWSNEIQAVNTSKIEVKI